MITSSDSVSGITAEPGHCKVNTVQTAAACTLPVSTLGTGALVVVSGLRERPEFNGVRGLIVGGLTTTGRWPVRLEGMEVAVAIRGCHHACISRTVQPQAHGRGCTPSSSVHSTAELGRDPRWMWKADGYESRVREYCGSAANLGLRQLDTRASDSASPSGCSRVGCGMPLLWGLCVECKLDDSWLGPLWGGDKDGEAERGGASEMDLEWNGMGAGK